MREKMGYSPRKKRKRRDKEKLAPKKIKRALKKTKALINKLK